MGVLPGRINYDRPYMAQSFENFDLEGRYGRMILFIPLSDRFDDEDDDDDDDYNWRINESKNSLEIFVTKRSFENEIMIKLNELIEQVEKNMKEKEINDHDELRQSLQWIEGLNLHIISNISQCETINREENVETTSEMLKQELDEAIKMQDFLKAHELKLKKEKKKKKKKKRKRKGKEKENKKKD